MKSPYHIILHLNPTHHFISPHCITSPRHLIPYLSHLTSLHITFQPHSTSRHPAVHPSAHLTIVLCSEWSNDIYAGQVLSSGVLFSLSPLSIIIFLWHCFYHYASIFYRFSDLRRHFFFGHSYVWTTPPLFFFFPFHSNTSGFDVYARVCVCVRGRVMCILLCVCT